MRGCQGDHECGPGLMCRDFECLPRPCKPSPCGCGGCTGGSSPWATTGQIADNMLKDENRSEENSQHEGDQSNMLDSEGAGNNNLIEKPEIENQDEPSGNTIEKHESVKLGEVDDKMAKKASEIRDNVESKAVKQNLGDGELEREQVM